jgi:hypothetical protein
MNSDLDETYPKSNVCGFSFRNVNCYVPVSSAIALIRKAKRPLLIIGSQATLSPNIDKVSRAVISIGIPCFLGGMARGLVGKNNPIQVQTPLGAADTGISCCCLQISQPQLTLSDASYAEGRSKRCWPRYFSWGNMRLPAKLWKNTSKPEKGQCHCHQSGQEKNVNGRFM